MKIVINKCYGGFGLSPMAVKRLAELDGKECYFFSGGSGTPYTRLSVEDVGNMGLFWTAFDATDLPTGAGKRHGEVTLDEWDDWWEAHHLDSRREEREDPNLIQVVEELGNGASGSLAQLEVVEIPDGTEYTIEEYDGIEWVAEKHQTWS